MFSPEDRWGMQQIATTCEAAGYLTYLPQRDGMELGPLVNLLRSHLFEVVLEATVLRNVGLWMMQLGFALDIYQLHGRCDGVVFNMNGRVPDDGSVMEASSAYTAGKPLVVYKETPVTLLSSGFDNPMIQGMAASWKYAGSMADLAPMLHAEFTRTASSDAYTFVPPAHLKRVIELGAKVWAGDEVVTFLRKLHGHQANAADLVAISHWLAKNSSMITDVFAAHADTPA